MLLLGLLLLPVALTAVTQYQVRGRDFIETMISLENGTLKEIRVHNNSTDVLDLSNLGIERFNENAFAHLSNLKTLNLANNSLFYLPENIFANLPNLEHLNLADNYLRLPMNFLNLKVNNLKTLNISRVIPYFSHVHFGPGYIFGLPKFTNIVTQGVETVINTAAFENPSNFSSPPQKIRGWEHETVEYENRRLPPIDVVLYGDADLQPGITVCIQDGHLRSVQDFIKGVALPKDCRKVNDYGVRIIFLSGLGIRTFESGWFRLKKFYADTLDLVNNNITVITRQMLNDLPPEFVEVNLKGNMIERLEAGIMERENPIELLDLSDNPISEIEDGALEQLNITGELRLNYNRLKSTKFLDTLPSNIRTVSLTNNEISDISAGNFSKFARFRQLDLSHNNITEAKAQRLHDFSSLSILELTDNALRKIEPGFFQGLKNLKHVLLNNNRISSLEKGVFSDHDSISYINLSSNKFTKISSEFSSLLPHSLRTLRLGDNLIEIVRAGSFVNAPKIGLYLGGNKISKIEKGSFYPMLWWLNLENNLLKEIDGDWFEGLRVLDELSLASNGITTLTKGMAKNLAPLSRLDLSRNPIKILENGALFGLTKSHYTSVTVPEVDIIQIGLFDDV